MKQPRFSRAKSWNDRGAIEGLPLQLMIMVIVAGVALAIILGWVLSIQTPTTIARVDFDPRTIDISGVPPTQTATKTVTITVRAYDQKGNPILGIAVTLDGAGAQRLRIDADDGSTDGAVVFANVQVVLPANTLSAAIYITVEKSGLPRSISESILVRRL